MCSVDYTFLVITDMMQQQQPPSMMATTTTRHHTPTIIQQWQQQVASTCHHIQQQHLAPVMTTMAVVTCQQTPLQPLHIASTHSASIFCCCFFVFLLYTPISTQQWWPHASCSAMTILQPPGSMWTCPVGFISFYCFFFTPESLQCCDDNNGSSGSHATTSIQRHAHTGHTQSIDANTPPAT